MNPMKRTGLYVVAVVCLFGVTVYSAPQAVPSGVSVKRFKEIPVDMATGELIQHEAVDLALKSRGLALEVSRNYRSRRETDSPFGYGWSWNHAEHLEFPGDLVIQYVTSDMTIPIYPDVSFTSAYARVCVSASGWEQGEKATGAPDAIGGYGNVAHYYGPIDSLQPLIVGGWNLQPPDGPSTILQVDLTSIGATGYDWDHPQYGVSLKLSAGGGNSTTWGHRAYDYDFVNITSDLPAWTWPDVNAVQARLQLNSIKLNEVMDVVVDTFHLGVTYTRNVSGEFKYLPGTNFELVKTNNEYWILNRNMTRLAFSLEGRLVRKTDASGNALTFHHDSLGRVVHVTDDVGQALTLSYENSLAGARVVQVADSLGRKVGYGYSADLLVAVTNVLGAVTRYDYDGDQSLPELRHNLVRRTDPEGHTVSCDYYTTNSTPDRVWRYRDGEVVEGRSNEVDYLYLKGTTYSFTPGTKSIQGVVYNVSNDVSHVYVREGELSYQTSDGFNLITEHAAGTATSGQNSSWENRECALGVTNGLQAHHPALTSNDVLTVSGWGFSVPGLSNDIVRVSLSVLGSATNKVCLSAMGMMFTNWMATNATWVTLDVTGDKGVWTWADISNLTARISLPTGVTNSAEVWIDGFLLKVSYRHFDPGRDASDAFYFHDLDHNLVSSEQGGAVHQFAYDSRGNLTTWTDPEGNVRRYKYDPVFSKPVQTWDARGHRTRMEYDHCGRLIKTTDAADQVSTIEYDRFGNPSCTTYPDGTTNIVEYDSRGVNVVKNRNRRGDVTTFDYDDFGNCVRITDAQGRHRQIGNDRAGQKVLECDEMGVETRFEYDHNGHLTNTVVAAGTGEETSQKSRYDGRGLVVETIDPRGVSDYRDYDGYGRVIYEVDKLGGVSITEYDVHDNPVRRYDPLGASWEYSYDSRGNLIASYDRLGSVATASFNGNNAPVSTTDRIGNRVETTYDGNGNIITETVFAVGYPGCGVQDIPAPVKTVYQYDALNRVTNKTVGVDRPDAQSNIYQYDMDGRLARETDALGNVRSMSYDGEGNLTNTCLINEAGSVITRIVSVYDHSRRPIMEITGCDAASATNRIEYDERGLKSAEIDALNRRTTFTYDLHRRLVLITRADGTTRRLAYDQSGNTILECEAGGAVVRYDRDAAGRLTNKVTGIGRTDARTVSFQYDLAGRLLRETDALGGMTVRAYDDEGTVLSETNKLGFVKTYGHDALGRVTNTVDELGFSIGQVLDGRGKLVRLMDRLGRVAVSDYDAYGRLIRLTDPMGNTSRWMYDRKDRVVRETDPRGLVSCYVFDAVGHMTQKTTGVGLPNARFYRFQYDDLGREVSRINPEGGCVGQSFDAIGNRVSLTNENGAVTRFTYDAMNRLTSVTDALGGTTRTVYDDRGNIIRVIDAMGNRTGYTYDAYNLRRSMTDPLGNTMRYDYDGLGRLTVTTDALGHRELLHYDAIGNVTTQVDKNGAVSWFEYDPLGRAFRTGDALGGQTRKSYDAAGNVVAAVDKCGFVTTYQYDAMNRPITVLDPASNILVLAYDPAGSKIRESTPSGRVTTYGYDAFGQCVSKYIGAGRSDVRCTSYEYNSMGRLVREEDPLGRTILVRYDAVGNKTKVVDRRGHSTTFDYDLLNRLVWTTDALGHRSGVEYDKVGRIVGATNRRGYSTHHAYDTAGHLVSVRDAKGSTTRKNLDAMGRCIEEVSINGLRTRFELDANGQLTNRVAGVGGDETRTQAIEYDLLGRKQRVVDPLGGKTEFTYDANGNATTVSVFGASGSLLRTKFTRYNSRNLPVQVVDALGNVWQTEYDSMGRKILEVDPLGNRTEYEYNVFDEITAVTDQLGNRTLTRYDLCGRVAETINSLGARTRYAYDPNGNRTAVIDNNGRAILTSYDSLNRIAEINRTMPDVPFDLLQRADVNGDGTVDQSDVAALEERLP